MCVYRRIVVASRRVSSQPADANLNAHANVANAEPSWQVTPSSPLHSCPTWWEFAFIDCPLEKTQSANWSTSCAIILPVRINRIVYNNLPHFIGIATRLIDSDLLGLIYVAHTARDVVAIGLSSLLCVQMDAAADAFSASFLSLSLSRFNRNIRCNTHWQLVVPVGQHFD